ncbi:MAG: heavy metal transporter [Alphaproteobacteria bacterium]|nr:heavy metal transporter [Alphaproteobacteria bacterium]
MKRVVPHAVALMLLGSAGMLLTAAFAPSFAHAATASTATVRTETFAIKNMTCPLCPVTVKKAMTGVTGVRTVRVDFGRKTATVTFDPSKTTADAITAASTNAGYPATPTR